MTTVSAGTLAISGAISGMRFERDREDHDVNVRHGFRRRDRASAEGQHVGLDRVRAAGVGHLHVMSGRAQLSDQGLPDVASAENADLHD